MGSKTAVGQGKMRIILGLMTFGPDEKSGGRITTLDELNKCLEYFRKAGYDELDTARMYINGKQEAWLAQSNWTKLGFGLATKAYPTSPGLHRAQVITDTLNTSLKELMVDSVDIFYLHAPDRSVPFAETLHAVNELYKQGKFKRLGLSNFTAFELAEIVMMCQANSWVRPSVFQAMYNAITRSIEHELIPACRRYGLSIVVYNPLMGGLFSGKYKAGERPEEGRFSDVDPLIGERYRTRYFNDATFEALGIVEPVVKSHKLTLIETALRWLVHHSALNVLSGQDGIILGVSSFDQLKSNLEYVEQGPLPKPVLEALNLAWLTVKPITPNYWHLELEYTYDTQKALFSP